MRHASRLVSGNLNMMPGLNIQIKVISEVLQESEGA